jgi:hypothetical protein
VTKKLTWEVDKTSLVLKVTDGAKETTWKLRKNMGWADYVVALTQITEALSPQSPMMIDDQGQFRGRAALVLPAPMLESVRTVDAEELAELQRQYPGSHETSEEASRAAQAREVARLSIGAKWFEADDDETYGIPIPDYDTGEVRPR